MFLDYAAQAMLAVYTDKLAGCLGASDGKDAYTQLPGSFHLLAESTGYPAFLEEYGFGMKLFHQDLLVFSGCVVVEVLLGEALFPGELARAVTVEDAEVTAGILPQRLQLTYGLYAGQCK